MWRNTHLSASRLSAYALCARKFFYNYVEKVPKEDQILDPESPATFGNAIHDAFETIYKIAVETKYEGPFPQDLIVSSWKKSFFDAGLVHPLLYQEGLRIIRLYGQRHNKIDYRTVIGIEQEITLQFEEFKITGYIDRLERTSEDEAMVVDYKSSRKAFTGDELDESLQMSIYGLAVREMYPWAKRVTFSFDMVRLGFEQKTTRTVEELADARDYVIELGRKTETDSEWKPTLGPFCSYCEFRNRCDEYKKALAKRHPATLDKTDLDALATEHGHVTYIAKAAYARQREIETILKNEIALSYDPPVLGGKVWDLLVTPQSKYDLEKLVKIGSEYQIGRDLLLSLFRHGSISKEEVKEWLAEAETKLDESTFLLLKKECEVIGLTPTTPRVSLKSKVVG